MFVRHQALILVINTVITTAILGYVVYSNHKSSFSKSEPVPVVTSVISPTVEPSVTPTGEPKASLSATKK